MRLRFRALFLVALAVSCATSVSGAFVAQNKVVPFDSAAGDWFGYSVSMSGSFAVVGAFYDDDEGESSGSAYFFAVDANTGDLEYRNKVTAPDGNQGDVFGLSVSISGSYAVISADGDDDRGTNSGSVHFFAVNSTTSDLEHVNKVTAPDGAEFDFFGRPVCMSGSYAIFGAYGDDDDGIFSGSAYFFAVNPTTGNLEFRNKVTAPDGAAQDFFGWSVSMSGAYAIVGAYLDDDRGEDSGSAYVFTVNPTTGDLEYASKVVAYDGAASDFFGRSVSMSGAHAIVGAPGDDNSRGSAYFFAVNPTTGNLEFRNKVTAPGNAANDLFGQSVSMSEAYAVVGAPGDDSSRGSAYVFTVNPTTGTLEYAETVVAPDRGALDSFGYSVSLSGTNALVGAYQGDEAGDDSGAAYFFVDPRNSTTTPGPSTTAAPTATPGPNTTAAPTATPGPNTTAAPTATPGPIITAAPTATPSSSTDAPQTSTPTAAASTSPAPATTVPPDTTDEPLVVALASPLVRGPFMAVTFLLCVLVATICS